MTSTNDGKDVKSNQTSSHKGKSYYIDLYKSLEKHLSEECELRQRTAHLCDTWRRVHSLCQHSAPTTHPHYLAWLQRHTADTLLQSEWQSEKDEHTKLKDAIDTFIAESKAAVVKRNGHSPDWEVQLVQRGEWFKTILENPWGHPVLKVLCDPRGTPPTDEEILEWLKEERALMFVARLRHLAASRKCHEIALSLATAVMDRVRACETVVPDTEQVDDQEPPQAEGTFKNIVESEAGFTLDVWGLITDLELVLLHKRDGHSQCIALAKRIPLRSGHQLVERLRSRPETAPREKKLWKNAADVATLVAQVLIARCMVVPQCAGAVRVALYRCARSLVRLVAGGRLPGAAAALAAPAATARHLHMLATAVHTQLHTQRVTDMNSFVCELYVRAITAGMNELEKLKIKTEKESEARVMEQTLSSWFVSLGALLAASARIQCECALTAFSVHPSAAMYDKIKAAPPLPKILVDKHEPTEETKSEFGSWASDSRSQTNLVKTSETLNLKQTQQHTNVMSTAIFSEGEAIGLAAELCQDLTVCLAGPRVKTLSWDMDREVLLENCRTYMERTHGGTRALTTELKYLNLDPRHYQHLPEEGDDENDLYYGIEKGYEHLVELQEETGWENFLDEETETAYSSNDEFDGKPVRRKKKSKRAPLSSEDDLNPLSNLADANKGEKKKERPHSKERSKERKKKPKDPDNKDSKEKKDNKEKKKTERKKKPKETTQPGSLASLIGVKIARTNEIAFTDSDYDSQGKSSQASEGNDPNVIYDGLFTMDYKSPDKIDPLSDQVSWNSEVSVTNGQVTVKKPKRKPVNKRKPKNTTTDTKPALYPKSVLKDIKPRPSAIGVVSDQVKRSITKLLQFRRNQKAGFALKNNTPKSNAIYKPDYPVQPFVSPKSVIVPEIPKSYINKPTLEKTYPSKSPSVLPNPQIGISRVNEFMGSPPMNRFDGGSPHIRPALAYSAPNSTSPVNYNAANVQSYYQNMNFSHQPHTSSAPQRSIGDDYSGVPPKNISMSLTRVEKPKREISAHEKCFEDFLKELKMSINAGTGAKTTDNPTGFTVKKEYKPPIRASSVMPSLSTSDLSVPLHCAKPASQKKVENAPNTFSRLSYMHKNKQSDIKQKQAQEIKQKQAQETQANRQDELNKQAAASLDLSRAISEFKTTKSNYMQTKGETVISRVENPLNLSYDSTVCKAEKSPTSRNHPVITSMLQINTSIPQTPVSKIDNATANKVTSPPGTYLSEKDQNDLVMLLRQQNRINAGKTVSRVGTLSLDAPITVKTDNTPKPAYANVSNKPNYSLQQKESTQKSKAPKTKPANTALNYSKDTTDSLQCGTNTVIIKASNNKRTKETNRESNNLDWESVMNAIRAQKTPSRGPSALELTLSCADSSDKSLRNQRIVRTNSVGKIDMVSKTVTKVVDAVIKHTNNENLQKPFGLSSAKATTEDPDKCQFHNQHKPQYDSQNKPIGHKKIQYDIQNRPVENKKMQYDIQNRPVENKKLQYDIQNRPVENKKVQYDIQNRPVENKKAVKNVAPKRPGEVAEKNKFAVSISKHKDPFISGRDDDYNLSDLDDLLDDDIRKELGELSSDEDAYRIPQAQKGDITYSKISNITKQGESSLLKEKAQDMRYIPKVSVASSDQRCSTNDEMTALTSNYPKVKESPCVRNQASKTKSKASAKTISLNQIINNITLNKSVNKNAGNKDKSVLQPTDLSSQHQNTSTAMHTFVKKIVNEEILVDPGLHHKHNIVASNVSVNKDTLNKEAVDKQASAPCLREQYASAETSNGNANNNLYVVENEPVIQVAVPATNVVVFGSEMYYNPLPTVQTQTGLNTCTVNQPYVQQSVPNITLYKPARFVAPVVTPVVLERTSVLVTTPTSANMSEATHVDTNLPYFTITNPNQHVNETEIITNNFDDVMDVIKECPEDKHIGDQPVIEATSNLGKKGIFDVNSNENLERKLISEVQENKKDNADNTTPLKLPRSRSISTEEVLRDILNGQEINQTVISNVLINSAIKNITSDQGETNSIKDIKRLKTKRLAILNREVTQRCLYPPIALGYSPIFKKKPHPVVCQEKLERPIDTNKEVSSHKMDKPLLHNDDISERMADAIDLIAEGMNDTPLLKNDDTKKNQSNDEHSKKGTGSTVEYRRILLRSSNKNLPKIPIITNDQNPVGRKTKVRLKSKEKPQSGIVKAVKDSQKVKIDKQDKLIIPEINPNQKVKRKTTVTRRKKTNLTSASNVSVHKNLVKNKIEDECECEVPINSDSIDIEDALLGAKMPNIVVDPLAIPSDSLESVANVSTKKQENVTILQDKKNTLRKRKSTKILNTNADDSNKIESETNIDTGVHTMPKSIIQAKDNNRLLNGYITENCLDQIIVTKKRQTTITKKLGLRSDVTKQSHSDDPIVSNALSSNTTQLKPKDVLVCNEKITNAKKDETSKTQSTFEYAAMLESQAMSNKPTSKIPNISKTIADLIEQINNGDISGNHKSSNKNEIVQSSVAATDTGAIQNNAIGNTKTTNEKVSSKTNDNNITTKVKTISEKNSIPQSYKDSIIIEEIPNNNTTSNVSKLLRVKLPNGKVYKASVYGKMHSSFDSLFEDPALRAMLMSNFNEQMKYTLNIKQVSTEYKGNPNKPIDARIQEIKVNSSIKPSSVKPAVVETINLLSDDEESDHDCSFKTKCGVYKTTLIDKDIIAKHQEKFDQNCFVRLDRLASPKKDDVPNNVSQKPDVIKIDEDSDSDNLVKILPSVNTQHVTEEHNNKNIPDVIEIDDESSNDSIDLLRNCPDLPVALLSDVSIKSNEHEGKSGTINTTDTTSNGNKGTYTFQSGNNDNRLDNKIIENTSLDNTTTEPPDRYVPLTKCDNDIETLKGNPAKDNCPDLPVALLSDVSIKSNELEGKSGTINTTDTTSNGSKGTYTFQSGNNVNRLDNKIIENTSLDNTTTGLLDRYVPLTKYDDDIESLKENPAEELDTSFDTSDVEVSSNSSTSILHDFALLCDKSYEDQYSDDDRTSPLIGVFERIASLRKKYVVGEETKITKNYAYCQSEWLVPKRQIRHEYNLIKMQQLGSEKIHKEKYTKDGRSSPVIGIFDLIASLRRKNVVGKQVENVCYDAKCQCEWLLTKRQIHCENNLIDTQNKKAQNLELDDSSLGRQSASAVSIPSLVAILSAFIQNSNILDRLQPFMKNGNTHRINRKKTSRANLKRKMAKLPDNIIANKISKDIGCDILKNEKDFTIEDIADHYVHSNETEMFLKSDNIKEDKCVIIKNAIDNDATTLNKISYDNSVDTSSHKLASNEIKKICKLDENITTQITRNVMEERHENEEHITGDERIIIINEIAHVAETKTCYKSNEAMDIDNNKEDPCFESSIKNSDNIEYVANENLQFDEESLVEAANIRNILAIEENIALTHNNVDTVIASSQSELLQETTDIEGLQNYNNISIHTNLNEEKTTEAGSKQKNNTGAKFSNIQDSSVTKGLKEDYRLSINITSDSVEHHLEEKMLTENITEQQNVIYPDIDIGENQKFIDTTVVVDVQNDNTEFINTTVDGVEPRFEEKNTIADVDMQGLQSDDLISVNITSSSVSPQRENKVSAEKDFHELETMAEKLSNHNQQLQSTRTFNSVALQNEDNPVDVVHVPETFEAVIGSTRHISHDASYMEKSIITTLNNVISEFEEKSISEKIEHIQAIVDADIESIEDHLINDANEMENVHNGSCIAGVEPQLDEETSVEKEVDVQNIFVTGKEFIPDEQVLKTLMCVEPQLDEESSVEKEVDVQNIVMTDKEFIPYEQVHIIDKTLMCKEPQLNEERSVEQGVYVNNTVMIDKKFSPDEKVHATDYTLMCVEPQLDKERSVEKGVDVQNIVIIDKEFSPGEKVRTTDLKGLQKDHAEVLSSKHSHINEAIITKYEKDVIQDNLVNNHEHESQINADNLEKCKKSCLEDILSEKNDEITTIVHLNIEKSSNNKETDLQSDNNISLNIKQNEELSAKENTFDEILIADNHDVVENAIQKTKDKAIVAPTTMSEVDVSCLTQMDMHVEIIVEREEQELPSLENSNVESVDRGIENTELVKCEGTTLENNNKIALDSTADLNDYVTDVSRVENNDQFVIPIIEVIGDEIKDETCDEVIEKSEHRVVDEITEIDVSESVAEHDKVVYENGSQSKCLLRGIEYEDPDVGTLYVLYPIDDSASESATLNDSFEETIDDVDSEDMVNTNNGTLDDDKEALEVNIPKITYSKQYEEDLKRRNLKRKIDFMDTKLTTKKYRKGKNIDYPKITAAAIIEQGYAKEYKRVFDYSSSLKFSYTQIFHNYLDYLDKDYTMNDWPIKGPCLSQPEPGVKTECSLFTDMATNPYYEPSPMEQSLAEEINQDYNINIEPSSDINETNFRMGFGEGSGRVIQNLEDVGDISKVSAATLSDVKQPQPFLLSTLCEDDRNTKSDANHEFEKLQRYLTFIKLREKVKAFFQKNTFQLKSDWLDQNKKDGNDNIDSANFPFALYIGDFTEPPPYEAIVQVVQVGQLPVSAAAQNPVTCDPRVTQVSDASPSQCSVENSPHDDSSTPIKTEYTELTTADLTLPLDYAQHNQTMSTESHENQTDENIPIETEIKSVIKIELEEMTEEKEELLEENQLLENTDTDMANHSNNDYSYEENNTPTTFETIDAPATYETNNTSQQDTPQTEDNMEMMFNSAEKEPTPDFSQQKQNGLPEKTDQIAHAMNAAGITTTSETIANNRAHALVNIINQKIRQGVVGGNTQTTANSYPKTTSINAMALQQALAQILPPPLNQTHVNDNNQQTSNTPQVLHIVQGKNASGSQITLVDNSQQSVISGTNATPVLHIVQNKTGTPGVTANGAPGTQTNSFSGLSLVDAGLQQGGNQLLHIVNTGSQKNNNAGQLLKRVNLLTNLANVQGSNEQKMVQFVCKSADGKSIQLNAPHQRSMVLRLQPIESPAPAAQPKPAENQDANQSPSATATKDAALQQEIKSRSVYEENYAKFIQNSGTKPAAAAEKSTSLPKFNQAFGKPVFQEGSQKSNDMNSNNMPSVNTASENNECQANDNAINLEHIGQISSPPLLLRKSPAHTSQAQTNLVQQIKQTIAPMNIQTMHGGVIYTRQIPVNIGGGQTINLITVPSTELIDESGQKQQSGNQGEIEPSIIKIVPQSQTTNNSEMPSEDGNAHMGASNENNQNPQPQPQQVLTQMRIKLPMLSKTPQMVSGARVVRPSFFQIQRNIVGGANQPVYQQLVLTAAPPLGQQNIRLPTAQANRTQIKVPTDNQSSTESMSSSTLEQLREFDMVLEQVKERSTVQPNSNTPTTFPKLHTTSSDTTDNAVSAATTPSEPTQVLYSIGNNHQLNVAYVNRKSTVTTPTTSTFVRSPDSSGIADSPTSSTHVQIPHTVTTDTSNETPSQPKPAKVGSKSKSRPKSSSHPPNSLKINPVPPKTSTQKPLEDEQTTQRILYILAEYKEQVENSPDKDKPAPRRRSNPPSNPSGHSKRKKSSSGSRRPGMRDMSPIHGDETCRTMGSEDSSCGTSQGDCNESCLDSHSPQDSPRKIVRKLTFEQETPVQQPRPQPQRNVIVADGQTITVARGTAGKPATAVLMPANYILPVSMVKGGQQIAIVTNRGPKLLTVGGEGGATNALLLQRLIGPAGLKPVLARPGVRHVRLPTAALHNLQAFNLATATTVQPPDSTASPAPVPTPDLVETRATSSPWASRESEDVKPERGSSPEGSEPWNLPSSADPHDYTYEETVRADNMDRTVLDPIPDRYSPDLEAQRIFDKMFDVDTKKSYIVDSPRCGYDIDASDCDDKPYHQVVHKKDGSSQRHHRLTHVSAAALRHKYAILEHELRLQKSLSEECEDLGVDSPSASELFPEAELLFAASPAHDHIQDQGPQTHTPQPTILNQSSIPQPDMDDQIATDQLLPREDMERQQIELGLGDVGIVSVGADGMHTITLDHEEFARAHPNTTFHTDEPTDDTPVQPFTIAGLKGRHITSTIFHAARAPATVLMTAPPATVISQPAGEAHNVKYADIDNMINSLPSSQNINLSSVLVKDDRLTRFDNILNDSRELHLTNTASAIVHSTGNATQVIRRVCYDDKRDRDANFLMDEPDALIAGDDAKMIAEDSSRDATLESMADVDDDRSSPERHAELFWESNSASERSESRRPLDFSSDSDKCCKSPLYDETNSTDSSGVGTHMRLDSVIKDARGIERSGSADGSSADDTHPPLRTYPPKRMYHPLEGEMERSLTGKTRAGERSPDSHEVRRRASGRGVVKRGCHCCSGSPAPPRPKKSRQRKPTMDFN